MQDNDIYWTGPKPKREGHPRSTILRFIDAYNKEHGYPPSVAEITEAASLRSTSSTAYQLGVLEARNLIARKPHAMRAVALTDKGKEEIAP